MDDKTIAIIVKFEILGEAVRIEYIMLNVKAEFGPLVLRISGFCVALTAFVSLVNLFRKSFGIVGFLPRAINDSPRRALSDPAIGTLGFYSALILISILLCYGANKTIRSETSQRRQS